VARLRGSVSPSQLACRFGCSPDPAIEAVNGEAALIEARQEGEGVEAKRRLVILTAVRRRDHAPFYLLGPDTRQRCACDLVLK
jgi:hypothetical protein